VNSEQCVVATKKNGLPNLVLPRKEKAGNVSAFGQEEKIFHRKAAGPLSIK
jgi:hypothetical protein